MNRRPEGASTPPAFRSEHGPPTTTISGHTKCVNPDCVATGHVRPIDLLVQRVTGMEYVSATNDSDAACPDCGQAGALMTEASRG